MSGWAVAGLAWGGSFVLFGALLALDWWERRRAAARRRVARQAARVRSQVPPACGGCVQCQMVSETATFADRVRWSAAVGGHSVWTGDVA